MKRSPTSTPEPTKPTKPATSVSSAKKSKATLTDREKGYLMERAMDLAYKSLPYAELSHELGIPESRLKDQFKPNRANLRKLAEQLFGRGGD